MAFSTRSPIAEEEPCGNFSVRRRDTKFLSRSPNSPRQQTFRREIQLAPVRHGSQQKIGSKDGLWSWENSSRSVAKFPMDLDHFFMIHQQKTPHGASSARMFFRWPLRFRQFHFRDCGNVRSTAAAVDVQRSRPNIFSAMAAHSMCQPGRPGPIGVSQKCSPGLGAFHNAKSRALSLFVASLSTRAPSCMPATSILESFPYAGKLAMR